MMNHSQKRFRFALGGAAVALLSVSSPAAAVELVSIPIDGIVTGTEGESILVAAVDVPDEFIGLTCEITGHTDNQESVHLNNDLLITTGGQTIVIPNFEDEGFIEHKGSDVEAISDTIEVLVRFGPDEISSGGFRVDVNCDIEQPTTTVPSSVPTTSDAPPPSGPTIDDSTPPTTTPTPSTATPTTSAPASTAPPPLPPVSQPQLPVTGTSTTLIAAIGVFIVSAGIALRDWAESHQPFDS